MGGGEKVCGMLGRGMWRMSGVRVWGERWRNGFGVVNGWVELDGRREEGEGWRGLG